MVKIKFIFTIYVDPGTHLTHVLKIRTFDKYHISIDKMLTIPIPILESIAKYTKGSPPGTLADGPQNTKHAPACTGSRLQLASSSRH